MSTMTDPPCASTPQTPSLTERMRSSTRQVHKESDRLVNVKLALVLTSPPLYGEALSLFLPVYERIESILDRRRANHPALSRVAPLLPHLKRGPGFRKDAEFYVPKERREEMERKLGEEGEPAELASYLEHLDMLEKDDPVRILAYVYHMYMAIFAGGYVIKKAVIKAMGLPKDGRQGVNAFLFDEGKYAKGLSKELKRILDNDISLTEEETRRVVDEGSEVFRRNNKLVRTVQGTGAWNEAAAKCAKRLMYTLLLASGIALAALTYHKWPR